MNKFFNIYDQNEEESIKDKLIDYSDIPREYISFLKIYYKDNHYIHIAIIDDTIGVKPNLVLIHGLGGSSLLYYKLFKELMSNFIIYAIDLPGLGW